MREIFDDQNNLADLSDEGVEAENTTNAIFLRHYISLLTPRQKEIATLVRDGYSQREISQMLSISRWTITNTLKACQKKYEKFCREKIA